MSDHGRRIAQLQEEAHRRNLEVDALGRVWCDGGCAGGMHRYQTSPPTEGQIAFLVRNARRAIRWWLLRRWKTAHASDPIRFSFDLERARFLDALRETKPPANLAEATACADPVCTKAQSHPDAAEVRGAGCSAFKRWLTGPLALSPEDPTHSLPEGVPYPEHQWGYVPTCTALDAARSNTR